MPQESFTVCIPLTKSSTLTLGDFPCHRAPTKLEEGNIFTGACQSFCPQGYLWSHSLSGWGWGIGISGTKSFLEGIPGTRSLRVWVSLVPGPFIGGSLVTGPFWGWVLLGVCISMGVVGMARGMGTHTVIVCPLGAVWAYYIKVPYLLVRHHKWLYTLLNKVMLCFSFGSSRQSLKVHEVKCVTGDPAIRCPVLFKGSRSPLSLA